MYYICANNELFQNDINYNVPILIDFCKQLFFTSNLYKKGSFFA